MNAQNNDYDDVLRPSSFGINDLINEQQKMAAEIEAEKQAIYDAESAEKRKRRLRAIMTMYVLGLATASSGLLLYADSTGASIIQVLSKNINKILAFFILFFSVTYILAQNASALSRFQDVDIRRRLGLKKKTSLSPAAAWPFPVSATPGNFEEDEDLPRSEISPFYKYFQQLTETLEQKALDAEEKASLLLDKGTTYTIAGIVFFIVSIIGWQIAAWARGFQTEFIYGIVSCSALFIFIEFLSAWFLKQYRHFIDTSTYLFKVKSIFDKFILTYLIYESTPEWMKESKSRSIDALVSMLEKDIKWPDTYLLKKPEVGFALEAITAINSLAKELRSNKDNKDKPNKPDEKPD